MAQKLLADSNRASLREIVEDNAKWGETPVAGVSRARRFTTSSITVTKDTAVSEEIRDDRMTSAVIETAASSGGEINWEFSAGNLDRDFQRVLMGAWSRPMEFDLFRGDHISITANNVIRIAGDDVSAYFTVGRRIKLSGFVAPANNDYLEIQAVAYAGGGTQITVTGTSLVAEAGSAFTTVFDANDVLVRKATTLRFGNAGARTIDGNGTGPFAAIVAAKQLVAGQRIFVEGVGYEKATLTFDVVADGETVVLTDGENSISFEAQADATELDIDALKFAIGADAAETAASFAAVVNKARAAGDIAMVAVAAAGVVTLTNLRKVEGEVTGDDNIEVTTAFAGGDATLGGFYKIVSITDDVITVDRDVPELAAGAPVTIKASMLRNPGKSAEITPQSATVETGFQDVSQFFVTDGLRFGNISLEVAAGAIITGTTTTLGRETKRRKTGTALLTSAAFTPLDAPATENVSATANVGALVANGEALTTALQSISIAIEGNLRAQQAVSNKFPVGISAGRLNVTGTITAYFADGFMFDKFLAHETMSLAFPIIDQDKNTYYFTIPAFKIMSDPIAPGGTDQDVMETLEFTAIRDAATKCMMQIDRFSSTAPVTAL
ncbi:hypothetical protein LAV_00015 [Sphingobium phage Lacusarx]|uniref:Major tail tube protein n=1 Tax=Sphingobium phage Lacusarx TaxID=1980139 RepID=A0A1W6DWY5_9CAUD|nr:minor tail protein [Sphingobium phage Lacusarx]ARK07415.1 hypothetical protein LAV_00015 [Sphingobium phage Lacusarx]